MRNLCCASCLVLTMLATAGTTPAQEARYLYKTQLLQAAPGKLLELIDLYKLKAAQDRETGEEPPLWMRHSQGDHWDLLVLVPVGSYAEYYRSERSARREKALRDLGWQQKLAGMVAWQEDVFVYGPPLEDLRKAFAGAGFFHVEMFQALPGKREQLLQQRAMENAYLKVLARPQNFIFVRDQGAAWDLFTLGVYRDLRHYAESADIPDEKEEAAAKSAGFTSASQIGPYLRTLIRAHHDTLAVAVK